MESPKWTEIAAVAIAFIGMLVTIIKSKWAISELFSRRRKRLRVDFQFIKENLADDRWEEMDDYSLAYSYWALTGYRFKASTLRYFFEQRDSLDKLIDYAYGARFLRIERDNNQKVIEISLKELFGTANTRRYQKKLITCCFILSAFLAVLPIILSFLISYYSPPLVHTSEGIFLGAVWMFTFIFLSIMFFLPMRDLEAAIRLSRELVEGRQ